ncbi:hypothetical protein ABZV31_11220 [Streptomyces sp. NPDC005202]|uniref:hypothetical protein n=1 Tax=Streptomyces sp. NPDC005202 TaxID=3157021 RepID=UPI0033BEF12E
MTAAVTAMITAVVGVLGTLFAPVLSQRLTARQRAEEARAAEERRRFEERRAAYTAMNRASRQFHTLLKDALHRIRDGVYTEQDRGQLEEARRDYRDRYAEAQMVVPERILDASRAVNQVLAGIDAGQATRPGPGPGGRERAPGPPRPEGGRAAVVGDAAADAGGPGRGRPRRRSVAGPRSCRVRSPAGQQAQRFR